MRRVGVGVGVGVGRGRGGGGRRMGARALGVLPGSTADGDVSEGAAVSPVPAA